MYEICKNFEKSNDRYISNIKLYNLNINDIIKICIYFKNNDYLFNINLQK